MAKTRLQAGAGDDDEDDVDTKPHKHEERYNGAIDCLQKVYAEEGIFGWYQVRARAIIARLQFFETCCSKKR